MLWYAGPHGSRNNWLLWRPWVMAVMTEVDAQSLYIHRKHVGLQHIYGEGEHTAVVMQDKSYLLVSFEGGRGRLCCCVCTTHDHKFGNSGCRLRLTSDDFKLSTIDWADCWL